MNIKDNVHGSPAFTTATPPLPAANGRTFQPPVFFRLPKPGTHDPYWSATRSWWNAKILPCEANDFRPPIKSVVDRKKGALRGTRFILWESAALYFSKLAAEQEIETGDSKTTADAEGKQ